MGPSIPDFAGMAGFGIAGYQPECTALTENAFEGNWAAAIALYHAYIWGGACAYNQVSNNRIKRFAGNGIMAEALWGAGTLADSGVSGNNVEDNGNDGILIEPAGANAANSSVDNEAEGNHTNDCEDNTYLIASGPGTALTWNTWFNNIGSLSSPTGLCTPCSGHHHD